MKTTQTPPRRILIANRGEIAVRVIRGAADAGHTSIAVYADPDLDALHVNLADESYGIGGNTSAESYLNIEKIIDAAKRSKADAVHPGYGFLSENAQFAQAVLDAGLIWIGPSPATITALGDKVQARKIAETVKAPLVPGTPEAIGDIEEVYGFVREHGLPIAIKAAHGGGGRGMKVVRDTAEIQEQFDSATRESAAAFGTSECFVERYLDNPRHVEAQVIADQHGNIVVAGTRDCSLQRRFQKLVEEAPAPFLTTDQYEQISSSAKAIFREASYQGAGTVEYLVGEDGLISFLEVNTRLQVEHCVSEEAYGIDLVQAQFTIAFGGKLDLPSDLKPRAHSIEFRINAEDPGTGFLPAPGAIVNLRQANGPGVRFDSGIKEGDEVTGQFDSLLGKLIITGEDREQALSRARRALKEFEIQGIATTLPFYQRVVSDPAFIGDDESFQVHTRWIETEWTNDVEPYQDSASAGQGQERKRFAIEIDGRKVSLTLPAEMLGAAAAASPKKPKRARPSIKRNSTQKVHTGDQITAPMQGTLVKIAVSEGQVVESGELLLVLESMKMETPVFAPRSGTVASIQAANGEFVAQGSALIRFESFAPDAVAEKANQ